MAQKTVLPSGCDMFVKNGSTEFQVVTSTGQLYHQGTALSVTPAVLNALNTTSVVSNNVSTAVTGSTVLTAALATAAELNTTNTLVNEIKATLVALGLASS